MFFSRPKTLSDLIKSGSFRKLQQRIDAANCNQPDEHGFAPLHYAVTYREAKIARYLLSQGSEPVIGEQGRHLPAINEVVNSLCLPLIEAFLDSGIFLPEYIDGLPLLHHFIRLLQAGISIPADEKGEIIDYLTSKNFRPKQVKLIFELNQSQGHELPLSILIHDSRTIRQIIDELPHDAPDINTMFIDIVTATGLRRDEKLSLLGTLLDKGADINTSGEWSHFQISALHIVAGWPDNVEHGQALLTWLLERGAAIECHGLSAFYLAVWFGHMETANLLATR
ncbi:hypothetical protein, partial [Symbiopectobacterium sp.]|uniref:hypothetical protein n=1 Tax=Symbiopectobacterium sp. TaxID=2952789 RepID=UPI003F334E52